MRPGGLQEAHGSFVRNTPSPPPRAQISIETLLILLLFLMVLGISYSAASNIGASAQKTIQASLSRASFNEFSSKLSEACSLGNGNVRVVEVKGEPARLSAEGNGLAFASGAFSSVINSSCEISLLQSQPSKRLTIKNVDGKIEVS